MIKIPSWWFGKNKPLVTEPTLYEQHCKIKEESYPRHAMYGLLDIKGICVTDRDGTIEEYMFTPALVHHHLLREIDGVGLLVESGWYNPEYSRGSLVEIVKVNQDQVNDDMNTDEVENIITSFKELVARAHLNGYTTIRVVGSPTLMTVLLPFLDNINLYVCGLPMYSPAETHKVCRYGRALIAKCESTSKIFPWGRTSLCVSKETHLNTYKIYNIVNLKPTELIYGK